MREGHSVTIKEEREERGQRGERGEGGGTY